MVKCSKCTRFPRLAKIGVVFGRLNESADLDEFGGPFSEEELADLVFQCGEAERLCDGGWILPDGAVLDFRRNDMSNNAVRHSKIYDFLSPERQEALERKMSPEDLRWSDSSIAIDVCLAAGFIRYNLTEKRNECVFYMSLEKKPTVQQLGILRDIEEYVEKTSCMSFIGIFECNGNHISYDDPREFSRRFVNDVMRCF